MKKKGKTAAQLMAELEADPVFQAREIAANQKRQARQQESGRLTEPILCALRRQGLQGASLPEIVERFAPLLDNAVDILLAGLVGLNHPRVEEMVVRALGAAKQPFNGNALVGTYERTDDEGLRFAILNTIALVRPHSIDDWLSSIAHTSAGETLRNLAIKP